MSYVVGQLPRRTGLGVVAEVATTVLQAGMTSLQLYFQWRGQHDATITARHETERDAAATAAAAKYDQQRLLALQQAAQVQQAVTSSQPGAAPTALSRVTQAIPGGSTGLLVLGVGAGLLLLLGRRG